MQCIGKLKLFLLLAAVQFVCSTSNANQVLDSSIQFTEERAPLLVKFSLVQKVFNKARLEFDNPGAKFNVYQGHGIGFGLGMEFGLNKTKSYDRLWTVSPNFIFTSYSLKMDGVFDADVFGFDEDATTKGTFLLAALEGSLFLKHYRGMDNGLYMIYGAGINVQQIQVENANITALSRVKQNGEAIVLEVLSNNRDFFNFEPQRQRTGFTTSLGVMKKFRRNQALSLELKAGFNGNDNIVETLESNLGGEAELTIKKSFIGLDISYQFAVNQMRVKGKGTKLRYGSRGMFSSPTR